MAPHDLGFLTLLPPDTGRETGNTSDSSSIGQSLERIEASQQRIEARLQQIQATIEAGFQDINTQMTALYLLAQIPASIVFHTNLSNSTETRRRRH